MGGTTRAPLPEFVEGGPASGLLCRVAPNFPRRFHFTSEPFRRHVVAVGPSWRAVLEKDTREIGRLAQRHIYFSGLVDECPEVVLSATPVIEMNAEAKIAELFKPGHSRQHRGLEPSLRVCRSGRSSNYPSTAIVAP